MHTSRRIRRQRIWSAMIAGATVAATAMVATTSGEVGASEADGEANLVPLVPARLLETRQGSEFTTVDGEFEGEGPIAAGQFVEFAVADRGGVDADAAAVMLNVTAVSPDDLGYLTVYPCSDEVPLTSNVNYFAGDIVPNSVLAKVSDEGTVCIFSLATTDAIVDVSGYVPAGGAPIPVEPARLVETRRTPADVTVDGRSQGIGRLPAGGIAEFDVWGRGQPGDIVPNGTEAVYLNVTAIYPDAPGYLAVYPCTGSVPEVSNVNYGPGDVAPNAVLTSVSDDGTVCIYSSAPADVIADVNAYLPPGGNRRAIQPARCADTRIPDGNTFDGLYEQDGRFGPNAVYEVQIAGRCNIADGASAAYLNVTAFDPSAPGYITVWPCDEPRPGTSNVNYQTGQIQPNAVLSKISLDGDGKVCLYSLAETDVIVDVNGYVPGAPVDGIEQISANNRVTCALMDDATVRCAGQTGYHGLGGDVDEQVVGGRHVPTPVPGLTGVTRLINGHDHMCAVRANGTVACWGDNTYGQLGDGTTEGTDGDSFHRRYSPVDVDGLSGVLDMDAASYHSCAVTDANSDDVGDAVECWGYNSYDQLGVGGGDSATPVTVSGLPAGVAPTGVATGDSHTCAALADGSAWCWGHGGRNGDSSGSSSAEPPAAVPGLTGVSTVGAAGNHTCVHHTDDTISCWGANAAGELGPRDATPDIEPATVDGLSGVEELVVGWKSTCVRYGDGTAECFGSNGYGELGDGSPSGSGEMTPVEMMTGSDEPIVGLSNDGWTWCAVLGDTTAVCWGYYHDGNMGAALDTHTDTPVPYGGGDLRSS